MEMQWLKKVKIMLEINKIYTQLPKEYLKQVLNYEGGYLSAERAKQIGDKGGETCRGITIGALQTAIHMGLVPPTVTCESLLTDLESVRKIYEVNYYRASRANIMPHPLSFAHFDASVNHGKGNGFKFLQRTLNKVGFKLDVDGGFGPKTLSALQEALYKEDIMNMTSIYCYIRFTFYNAIVKNNPSQGKFYNGWINRLTKVKLFCGVK
jgi:lysozyme family protein